MTYSYIEKKRIRKFFGKLVDSTKVPHLLAPQLDSYLDLIEGRNGQPSILHKTLLSIFPIVNQQGDAEVTYLEHSLEEPLLSEEECLRQMTNYAYQLKIKLRFALYNKIGSNRKPIETRDQWIYLGDLPKMTPRATFIINGNEKVVVSQLHRSPGVLFVVEQVINSIFINKNIYTARIVPNRGAWLDIILDSKDLLFARIDKKKKFPISYLLLAMGYSIEKIISTFYKTLDIFITHKEHSQIECVLETKNLTKCSFNFDILDNENNVLIKSNSIISKKEIDLLLHKGIDHLVVPVSFFQGKYLAANILDEKGNILYKASQVLDENLITELALKNVTQFSIIQDHYSSNAYYIANTLALDPDIQTKEDALYAIYRIMRPGEQISNDSYKTAKSLFQKLFFDSEKYDLSPVGRMKINISLGKKSNSLILTNSDILEIIKRLIEIREGQVEIDDMDHLVNRRVRTVGEMIERQIQVGLYRIQKLAIEKISGNDYEKLAPQDIFNAKPLVGTIKEFFNQGMLSQFMDQDNPLSEITHKRRVSSLGPGGLSRDRASFEVRDVHTSHYGRLCTIETPEGPNIGLINALACYARINEFGFLESPYLKVSKCMITDEIVYLTAIEEEKFYISQANIDIKKKKITSPLVTCRYNGDVVHVLPERVDYIDVSSQQMLSVAASLIPFIEHNDANRALMGSNMQRQAVPTLLAEKPLVGTGMERIVAQDSGACISAKYDGQVISVESKGITVARDLAVVSQEESLIDYYPLIKFKRSNKNTCINQRPVVHVGDMVKQGDILADASSTDLGELALGHNVLIAFMSLYGYSFEDSICISERIVQKDYFTSIHIEEFTCVARDTKLGPEEITNDIPYIPQESLRPLDETGIIRIGARVSPGDILVGKITPKAEEKLTPEEKLLRAIFGEKSSDVKDSSLRVPSSMFGCVIDVQVLSRDPEVVAAYNKQYSQYDKNQVIHDYLKEILVGISYNNQKLTEDTLNTLSLHELVNLDVADEKIKKILHKFKTQIEQDQDVSKKIEAYKLQKATELSPGILTIVKVSIAVQCAIQSGDKLAGRHGNKGIVSRVLPVEDMPYMADGTPIDMVLTPLGIPSRMNIGQVFEAHMGLAAKKLGDIIDEALQRQASPQEIRSTILHVYNSVGSKKINLNDLTDDEVMLLAHNLRTGVPIATPPFDGASEQEIKQLMKLCGLDTSFKIQLFDGQTGLPFDQKVSVGYMYMLKLDHLVDNKMHARSTGSYSLVTQQPLSGKSQFGGQRFGEMEVWALQAYGAAYTLQEMLTIKSDDVVGRNRMYKNIIDGNLQMNANIPESFNVLKQELRSLGLRIEMLSEEESHEDIENNL